MGLAASDRGCALAKPPGGQFSRVGSLINRDIRSTIPPSVCTGSDARWFVVAVICSDDHCHFHVTKQLP